MKYDCTYWWKGGRETGWWVQADPGTRQSIERLGYVAVDGSTRVGPPVAQSKTN